MAFVFLCSVFPARHAVVAPVGDRSWEHLSMRRAPLMMPISKTDSEIRKAIRGGGL